MRTPENRSEYTEPVYPLDYFSVQVAFANKFATISQKPFSGILLEKTSLYRCVTGIVPANYEVPQSWKGVLREAYLEATTEELTQALYDSYVSQPHSAYAPPTSGEHGAWSYRLFPEKQAVQLHFTPLIRGESPLTRKQLAGHRATLGQMLNKVQGDNPDVTRVIAGSWLLSTQSFRSLLPLDIQLTDITGPEMFFGGESLWGQFLDRDGQVKHALYRNFIASITSAQTVDQLMQAFPYRVLFSEDSITKYTLDAGVS